ncbi:MAG: Bcr/CflA family efflux MFS transporter [Pseudomonadota bacterium]
MRINSSSLIYIGLLGALSAIPPLSIDMGLPAIPAMELSFEGARNHGALTLSLFLLGFGLSPLVAGPALDHFGRRPVMLAGLLLMALAAAACTFAQSFPSLLIFRFLQGLGAGACVVIPIAVIRDLFEGAEARVKLSQITAVLGIAPIVAPLIGGGIMLITSWRMIFAVQALASLLLLLLAATCMQETLKPEHKQHMTVRAVLMSYRKVLSDTAFRTFTLIFASGFACIFSYISGSATLFMVELGLTEQAFSLVFALTAFGMFAGFICSGNLSRNGTSSKTLLKFGLLGLTLVSLLLLALGVLNQVYIGIMVPVLAFMLFCFGLIAPSATHEAMQHLPDLAGAAAGISRSVQFGMGSLASALTASAMSYGRPSLVMGILMVFFAFVAGLTFLRRV